MSKTKSISKKEAGEILADILRRTSMASVQAENGGPQPFDWHTVSRIVFAVAMDNDIEIPEP